MVTNQTSEVSRTSEVWFILSFPRYDHHLAVFIHLMDGVET